MTLRTPAAARPYLLLVLAACATPRAPQAVASPLKPATGEKHFKSLTQLTFGGENAEAYWSFDGKRLSFQAHGEGQRCDAIFTMDPFASPPAVKQASSGKGGTTCAHFFPSGDRLLYASTHLAGDECPPKPDMSQGYVWALHESYDIFSSRPDGTDVRRLTDTPGYDAEGTVCARDGSIVFTSVRDGDLELYRMDADGKNVKRLTFTPGYDGGAFFSADCSKLVWRASRPAPGQGLEEYQALLKRGLVRPSRLELYVANADGTEPRQLTYLDAASFAPFFFPDGQRVIFSSNAGDSRGREFDLWAINVDGTGLERLTTTPGFDGFPMFSPDGRYLVLASNRATAPGKTDTNLFLAEWDDAPPPVQDSAGERLREDVRWLADPSRQGRGVGLPGLEAAGAHVEERFKALGLAPAGDAGGYRQQLTVPVAVRVGAATRLEVGGRAAAAEDVSPLAFSAQGTVRGQAVLAGWGLQSPELGIDDYAGVDVKGKVVVVRRFAPAHPALDTPAKQQQAGDLRRKAFVARSRGALALVVVDWPLPDAEGKLAPEAPLLKPSPASSGDAGLPVVLVRRKAVEGMWEQLSKKKKVPVTLTVALEVERAPAFNVVGRVVAQSPSRLPGVVLVGAHYDHLGMGGPSSLTPDRHEVHPGADDNASGTAVVLEVARRLSESRASLTRDVVLMAFTAEEAGLLGSAALVASSPEYLKDAVAMVNLDMVGQLRANTLSVLGTGSAAEWPAQVEAACAAARVRCTTGGDGYGPSDHTSFFAVGLPVLHLFTGAHAAYHKPSDTPEKLNVAGMVQVVQVVLGLVAGLPAQRMAVVKSQGSSPGGGDARSFGASLGTVPDYAGPPAPLKGVLLSDVRPGGAAELAGMRRGDVLVKLGATDVRSVEDLMYVLQQAKPGQTVKVVVVRDGKEVALEATYQQGRR